MKNPLRVFSLFSGGCDSLCSTLLMKKEGFEVIPIFFETPFFPAIKAKKVAEKNNLELLVVDFTDEILAILKKPRYGFGRYTNPCIDCHGAMFAKAFSMRDKYEVDFIVSGEVVGQRPMSQRKDSLAAVAKISGIRDYIVRPLSQKLLADTLPITRRWVDKNKLFDISGRSRRRQISFAKSLGVKEIPSSAGGCLLTNPNYSKKVSDLIGHNQINRQSVELLSLGRHFRISEGAKLILGRNEAENNSLEVALQESSKTIIKAKDFASPFGAFDTTAQSLTEDELKIGAGIYLSYCKASNTEKRLIFYGQIGKETTQIFARALKRQEIGKYRINPRS